ncbi:hypothetical protein B9Z35_05605 [Limnohabitans sp. Jir61]|uniref:NUMOD3 domain-containing DNA-binding protein n=1 Tax=Limnohabitans sp. Jir61 TaxID=1826168 RepID=UPI000D3A88C5|nr:NUMOD3 domain-containing DNA-binding protein [Limnohabitans sp. Jir61]PUE32998.1 hypothetical protein B9Z35_05605 [Limnohabitans sp. Jir61]
MTLAYVYKWTELATGKWYVGARGARGCHPEDGYICSSKVVKPLIQANPSGWQREILFTSEPVEVFFIEAKLLDELNAKDDPQSFNKHNGDGKWSMRGKQFSPEHREKMGAWQVGRKFEKSSIDKRTESRKGFRQSEEARNKIGQSLKGQRIGISPSEEQRKKISAKLTGRVNGPLSAEHKALLSQIKKGFRHTEEAIAKMKAAHQGKVLTEEHKAKISASGKGIKKSEETKARMRKPKVKTDCPQCGMPCAPHMLARHIEARHK